MEQPRLPERPSVGPERASTLHCSLRKPLQHDEHPSSKRLVWVKSGYMRSTFELLLRAERSERWFVFVLVRSSFSLLTPRDGPLVEIMNITYTRDTKANAFQIHTSTWTSYLPLHKHCTKTFKKLQ